MFDPESYNKSKNVSSIELETSINNLLNHMKWNSAEKILDYGCGPGIITQQFLEPKARETNSIVHCVDVSETMIQYAQNSNKSENVNFFVGNILSDDLKDKKYNKIFAIHLLNWIKEPREILQKFHEILEPSGHLGFIVGSGGYFQNKLLTKVASDSKWNQFMQDFKDFDYMYMYDNPEDVELFYYELLTNIGFRIVECENKDGGQDPISLQELTVFYKSLNPYLNKVPLELHNDLEVDYLKYLKQFLKLDDTAKVCDIVPHSHKYLSVVAMKD